MDHRRRVNILDAGNIESAGSGSKTVKIVILRGEMSWGNPSTTNSAILAIPDDGLPVPGAPSNGGAINVAEDQSGSGLDQIVNDFGWQDASQLFAKSVLIDGEFIVIQAE